MALTPYNKKQRQLCCNSLWHLCKEVLNYKDMEDAHRVLCSHIESKEKRKFVVGARGIFKTSIGTIARAIQILLIDPDARILVVANIKDNAEKIVLEIKNQFDRNEKLQAIMGKQIPETKSSRWSKAELLLTRSPGCVDKEPSIMAAGVETQLASLHYSAILGDDVVAAGRNDLKEGGMIILRPEEVAKAIGWEGLIRGLCINVADRARKTEVQFIVNRWGVKDFAEHIISKRLKSKKRPSGYAYLELGAFTETNTLAFHNILNAEDLAEIKESQGDWMYATQYLCAPYSPEDRGFPPENNVYWDGQYPPDVNNSRYRIYGLMDIADKDKPAACYTACVILWIDDNNHIWIGEAVREKIDTNGKIRLIHKMVQKYGLRKFHIEKNLHDDTLRFTLAKAMKEAGIHYRVVPLEHKNRNKDARIMRLQHHHETGAIHFKTNQLALLEELRDFPFTHRKDIADALGYIMDFIKGPPKGVYKPVVVDDPNVVNMRSALKSIAGRTYGGGPFKKQTKRRLPLAM